MGVEKRIMVLWICAMVISSMVMEEGANATPISYPGLGKNRQVPCKIGGGLMSLLDRGDLIIWFHALSEGASN
ncbi:hypothetical protein PVK06_040778 [Gossypium arboreum]|uniref:Uncharacterized protein n=1 Tax=Gossypium arboreum TaxID=29729 RepID=A0ABR0N795_GOSAR|nr:hypothetical protein PVK06_040778 [Gossypium arboreum]